MIIRPIRRAFLDLRAGRVLPRNFIVIGEEAGLQSVESDDLQRETTEAGGQTHQQTIRRGVNEIVRMRGSDH